MTNKEQIRLSKKGRWVLILIAVKLLFWKAGINPIIFGLISFWPAYRFSCEFVAKKYAVIYSVACFFDLPSLISLVHLHARILGLNHKDNKKRTRYLQ